MRDAGRETFRRELSPAAAVRQEPQLAKFWANEKIIFPAWSMTEILNYLAVGLTSSLLSSNETDPGIKTLHTLSVCEISWPTCWFLIKSRYEIFAQRHNNPYSTIENWSENSFCTLFCSFSFRPQTEMYKRGIYSFFWWYFSVYTGGAIEPNDRGLLFF